MGQEPQTMQEYKTQREKDWNAYRDIHGILDPGYLTRTDYMDKYDSDHATLIASITLRQNSQNEHSQNKQSENKSENQHDDVDMRDSDHKKNKHNRRRRNKRSKDKQNDNHNTESPNHAESVNTKKPLQKSAEKRDKDDGEKAKSGKNEKSENNEKSKKNAEAETSKSQDKQASKATKTESSNAKKNVASSESEELSAQSSTMLDNDQAEVSKKSLSAIIHNNKKQNKHSKHDESDLSNLDKITSNKSDKSESGNSYLREFPTEVRDYAIKKVGELVRSQGFTGDKKLINKLSRSKKNLVVIYIMSQMDDEYFNNCSNRTDISDQLIEAARAVRSVKKSQEVAKKPPMARDAKRAKEYSRDTYYLVEEILRLLALQFGTTKMKFQAGETDVAEGSISEMNKINFNMDFVKSMMVALQRQTQADLEKARLRKGSNSISATSGYDELI